MKTVSERRYNYRHFRTRHLVSDVIGTWQLRGIRPGQMAPEVELRDAQGKPWSLGAQLGRPVLLHFGSYT